MGFGGMPSASLLRWLWDWVGLGGIWRHAIRLSAQVATTILKEPKVSRNVPTVAEMTQGEVIKFAAAAAEAMRADGMNVLIEGREQTLQYVRTHHRFELVLSEPLLIGMRRAAQRMIGGALARLSAGSSSSNAEPPAGKVLTVLQAELASMAVS